MHKKYVHVFFIFSFFSMSMQNYSMNLAVSAFALAGFLGTTIPDSSSTDTLSSLPAEGDSQNDFDETEFYKANLGKTSRFPQIPTRSVKPALQNLKRPKNYRLHYKNSGRKKADQRKN